jgi:hypothetical protein
MSVQLLAGIRAGTLGREVDGSEIQRPVNHIA